LLEVCGYGDDVEKKEKAENKKERKEVFKFARQQQLTRTM